MHAVEGDSSRPLSEAPPSSQTIADDGDQGPASRTAKQSFESDGETRGDSTEAEKSFGKDSQ